MMKKIFTLLLLVFCLTMQAQIQRTIAGCTLGSSMSEVKSILKKNGCKIEYVDNETLIFQMSTFDGMKTESVKFCFYNDKLYDVDIYFKASTEESEMQSEFLKINEYLNSKYGNYIMHTDNNDIISYKDEQTMCYLRKFSQKVNEELSIYLFFIGCFDNALMNQKQKDEKDNYWFFK